MSKVGSWSTTAGSNNTTPPDGWPEGQAPSTVNDCAREMMAQIRTVFNDSQWFDQNFTPTFINTTSFSVTGDQTSAIHAGRRLKIYDATAGVSTVIYATVVTASFTTVTTISISADAGQLTSSLSSFALAILSRDNDSLPRGIPISASSIGTGNITINGTTTASGAVSLLTTLSVSGAVVLKSTLSVGGAVNFGSTFTASGAVVLNTTLTASGAVSLLTTLSVSGATVLKSTLSVGGATNLATTLSLGGAATFASTFSVSGATVLKSTLSVGGAVIIADSLTVSGTAVAVNIAKAWARFSGSGVATLNSSFNIASASRSAVGVYKLTFSTAFVDTTYFFSITSYNNSGLLLIPELISSNTTDLKFRTHLTGSTVADSDIVCVTCYR